MPTLYGIKLMEERAREAARQAQPYLMPGEYVQSVLIQPYEATDPSDAMVQTNRRFILCSPDHVTAILPRGPTV